MSSSYLNIITTQAIKLVRLATFCNHFTLILLYPAKRGIISLVNSWAMRQEISFNLRLLIKLEIGIKNFIFPFYLFLQVRKAEVNKIKQIKIKGANLCWQKTLTQSLCLGHQFFVRLFISTHNSYFYATLKHNKMLFKPIYVNQKHYKNNEHRQVCVHVCTYLFIGKCIKIGVIIWFTFTHVNVMTRLRKEIRRSVAKLQVFLEEVKPQPKSQ